MVPLIQCHSIVCELVQYWLYTLYPLAALYVAAGIGGGIGGAIAVIVIYTIVLPVVCICACKKLRLKSVNLTTSTTDTQSNAAYGYVGGGKMPSVSAEYETITTTVDVQSNDVSGKILSTAVYDTVTTDS